MFTGFALEAALPEVGAELPVYVGGAYPEGFAEEVGARAGLEHLTECHFTPLLSLLHCGPGVSLGPATARLQSSEQALQRAEELLGPLLMEGYRLSHSEKVEEEWRLLFVQIMDGRPIYTDKPLQLWLTHEGQITYLLGRRRPLVAVSQYPSRSPQEAWRRLQEGRGFGLLGIPEPAPSDSPFVVDRVEIGYVVPHVLAPREVLQPYYIFWSGTEGVVIPAVADPYVTWPLGF